MADELIEKKDVLFASMSDNQREIVKSNIAYDIEKAKKESKDKRSYWERYNGGQRAALIICKVLIPFLIYWPISLILKEKELPPALSVVIIIAIELLLLYITVISHKSHVETQVDALSLLAMQEYERRRNSIYGPAEQKGFVISKIECNNNLTACVAMDTTHKKVLVKDEASFNILSYSQIVSYELCKNGKSVVTGDASGALAGALLFGTAGAVVGAAATSKNVDQYCSEMYVSITDDKAHRYKLYLIRSTVAESSTEYKKALECARDMFSILSVIEVENAKENKKPENNSTTPIVEEQTESAKPSYVAISEADEIVKFKELLDKGVITQDEFDAKKKQLLGL